MNMNEHTELLKKIEVLGNTHLPKKLADDLSQWVQEDVTMALHHMAPLAIDDAYGKRLAAWHVLADAAEQDLAILDPELEDLVYLIFMRYKQEPAEIQAYMDRVGTEAHRRGLT
jgi:hypothetical protein